MPLPPELVLPMDFELHGCRAYGAEKSAAFAGTGSGHKRRSFVLDNEFSPAYSQFVKRDRLHYAKDRLHDAASIIC